jgi:hypothetical protein
MPTNQDALLKEMQALLDLAAELWLEAYPDGGDYELGRPRLPGSWEVPAHDAFVKAYKAKFLVLVAPPAPVPDAFDRFWQVYPRHVAKKEAAAAWLTALKRATADVIIEGARRYRNDPNRVQAYTKHPTTWLRGDCWGDDPVPARPEARPVQEQERTGAAQRAIAKRHDAERRQGEPERVDPTATAGFLGLAKEALVKPLRGQGGRAKVPPDASPPPG